MAFTQNTRRTGNEQQNDESWKAAGFINFYLPTADGGRRKVGAIPLKAAKPLEADLANRLGQAVATGDEATLQAFVQALQIEYNPADAPLPAKQGFVFAAPAAK